MKRREFIATSGLATMGLTLNGMPGKRITTAADLHEYLRSLYTIKEPSVDRIIAGDPDTKIKKVGTCWMPYFKTLRKAKELGINVLIVHEPTFYTHWDLDGMENLFDRVPSLAQEQYQEAIDKKKKWIEDNNMVIIRSHDVMDIVKGFGMPFALGKALGFDNSDIVRSKDYFNVYRIKPDTSGNVAKTIASSLLELNQPGVAFYGESERIVSTVGLGTGCICNPMQYQELKPDLVIAIDDTIRTWTQTTYAEDTGDPLVVINHGTSEEMGMRLLSQHLTANISGMDFIHLNQGCSYRWITGE
ncbi:MAG: Nif3-like dinuclear metal center hexameric protein [Bacteroidota bacterium]